MHRRLAVPLIALAMLAALPASAGAAAKLKGIVAGQAYAIGGGVSAVPVLLTTTSARKAHLSSPLVLLTCAPRRSFKHRRRPGSRPPSCGPATR